MITRPFRVPVPDAWLSAPPTTLVIGDGPYVRSLGLVLGASCLGVEELMNGPAPNDWGGFPRVLADLERTFIVAGTSNSPGESLRVHTTLWEWVTRLSPNGEQHELAIVFVIPQCENCSTENAINIGLGLSEVDPTEYGHAFILMDASLETMLTQVGKVRPMDLPSIRSRQACDLRHAALQALLSASSGYAVINAARRVSEVFHDQEYLLDLFCRPPRHVNGNHFRTWLNMVVTGVVSPIVDTASLHPSDWLENTIRNTR